MRLVRCRRRRPRGTRLRIAEVLDGAAADRHLALTAASCFQPATHRSEKRGGGRHGQDETPEAALRRSASSAVLVSNIWTISRWSESRGVYDDVCYLRQAHLFQRFGLRGIDTDITSDDDHYLKDKLKAIGFAEWNDAKRIALPHLHPGGGTRYVMQYPPGTGFVLALFPGGFQVIPLYVLTSVVAVGFAFLALPALRQSSADAGGRVRRCRDLPDDQSDQGELFDGADHDGLRAGRLPDREALWSRKARHRLALTALVGGLIGLSVNFRLPNLFLAAGYGLFLAPRVPAAREAGTRSCKASRSASRFLIGMAPTLIANAINAGSPVLDHLWRRRRRAARVERGCGVSAVRRRRAVPADSDGGALDRS